MNDFQTDNNSETEINISISPIILAKLFVSMININGPLPTCECKTHEERALHVADDLLIKTIISLLEAFQDKAFRKDLLAEFLNNSSLGDNCNQLKIKDILNQEQFELFNNITKH